MGILFNSYKIKATKFIILLFGALVLTASFSHYYFVFVKNDASHAFNDNPIMFQLITIGLGMGLIYKGIVYKREELKKMNEQLRKWREERKNQKQ